nr:hypothetical protein [Tanacetum cinerariifolium]
MDVEVEKDDLNQKFLTSLAPEWLMHTIVWRNRNDLDTMSLNDLYNHLNVYKAEVQKKSNPNSQNMAFISSSMHSSREEDGNTACVSTSSTTFPTASASVATISQDTASAYIASQSNDKFWKETGKKISIQRLDVAGFDKSKVECFNCHKMGHFARECRAPKSQERGRKENYRQGSKAEEKTPKALMAIDGVGWDWSYMGNEGEDHALVANAEAPIEFTLMANTESKVFDNSLCSNDCKKNNDSLNRSGIRLIRRIQSLGYGVSSPIDLVFFVVFSECRHRYAEVVSFYNRLDVPTRKILDSKGAIPSKTVTDAKVAVQETAKYSQKWYSGTSRTRSTKTSDGLAAIQAQLNNLGREIKKVNEKAYAAK